VVLPLLHRPPHHLPPYSVGVLPARNLGSRFPGSFPPLSLISSTSASLLTSLASSTVHSRSPRRLGFSQRRFRPHSHCFRLVRPLSLPIFLSHRSCFCSYADSFLLPAVSTSCSLSSSAFPPPLLPPYLLVSAFPNPPSSGQVRPSVCHHRCQALPGFGLASVLPHG
jgi:hypothetical protein